MCMVWHEVCLSCNGILVAFVYSCFTFLQFLVFFSPHSSAWLSGYEHSTIEKINQRIEDITGLEMDTAEELQVRGTFTQSANQMLLTRIHLV